MKLEFTSADILALSLAHLKSLGFAHKTVDVTEDGRKVALTGYRFAGKSFGEDPHICRFDWPIQCAVQCGGDGMVIERGGPTIEQALSDPAVAEKILLGKVKHKRTAFFEAFPKEPRTFLRGEGETVEAAEDECWGKWQKILSCTGHEFERRDRTDGFCYCVGCGLSGMFMQPLYPCAGCGANDYSQYGSDKDGKPYCKKCYAKLPESALTQIAAMFAGMLAATKGE